MFAPCYALALILAATSPDPRLEAAEAQGRKSAEATVKGDYETLLDLTHPKLVTAMGGREPALRRIRKEMTQGQEMGLTFESYEVGAASDLHQTKDGLFCIVPMTLRLKLQGKILARKSALLGVSTDGGKTWKFADTTPGEKNMRKLLPEIPAAIVIPKAEKPTFEPDTP